MDPNEILTKILRRYGVLTENIRAMQIVESKIKKKIATYADAEDMSIRIGKALTTALKENLPDALTDGRLYRAVAEVVLEQPMKTAGKDVAKIATAIQQELNEKAGIGIKAITPDMNHDQIDGIITGICNADSYEDGAKTLFAQVENCLEGYVDDFVRANADFQYQAGLDPIVIRTAAGKCCTWCSKLAGTYKYEDVRDKGNDVWRRHRNCHCLIEYDPGKKGGSRKIVSGQRSTTPGKADRIALEENLIPLNLQMFAHKTGDYRRAMYGNEWQEASLKETIGKFAKGAKGTPSKDKQKTEYRSKDGRYLIKYDIKGDYFRVIDQTITNTGRQYVGLNGEEIVNVKENGKKESVDPDEYNRRTHFINTDKRGR